MRVREELVWIFWGIQPKPEYMYREYRVFEELVFIYWGYTVS